MQVQASSPTWLARLPVGLFAIPVGLYALGGAWRRGEALGWTAAAGVSAALKGLALAVLGVLLVLYAAKIWRHPQAARAESTHPVGGSLLALIPLALLLTAASHGSSNHGGWLALTLLALALQAIIAFRVVAVITTGALPAAAVTPALYVPPVAGGYVGAMALHALGYPGWAALLFGVALSSWALLEARVLNSLFAGPLPEPARPTIGLELAPPTVGTLCVATLWPQLPGELLIIGLGIAAGPIVAVLARYKWWHQVPFSPGFWSFSFPVAAFAGSIIEVVRRGGWPAEIAAAALALASAIIGYLLVRTLLLLIQGRIVPPPTAPAAPRQG